MKTAPRTKGAANGKLPQVLLLVIVVLSLVSLWLARAPPGPAANGGELHLPILLAELKDRGYLLRHGGRAVFLGDTRPWLSFLERNHVAPVSAVQLQAIPDESVDCIIVVVHGDGAEFGLVNRVLKAGGVATVIAASNSAPLRLPDNNYYKVVFVHRNGNDDDDAVIFAAEKTTSASAGSSVVARPHHRKLLTVAGKNKNKGHVLDGLEGVLLEPPHKPHVVRRLRPKYLPELTGDSLEGYRRRVFVDVAPAPGGGAASWFEKHYPRGRHEFESVRLTAAAEPAAAAAQSVAAWLEGNVVEEDYVVVKAGVEAAEEMLRKGAAVVRRVDELFLDCGEGDAAGGGGGSSGRRPYWQCLALYGRLRDQGVAVHQWWSGMLDSSSKR